MVHHTLDFDDHYLKNSLISDTYSLKSKSLLIKHFKAPCTAFILVTLNLQNLQFIQNVMVSLHMWLDLLMNLSMVLLVVSYYPLDYLGFLRDILAVCFFNEEL